MTRECALPQICNAGYLAPPNAEDRHPTAINISTLLLISNSFIASHITLIYLHKSIHIALHNTADLNLSTRLATIQSCTHVNTNIANSYQSTTLALKNLHPSRLASSTQVQHSQQTDALRIVVTHEPHRQHRNPICDPPRLTTSNPLRSPATKLLRFSAPKLHRPLASDQLQLSTDNPSNKREDGLTQHTTAAATNASIINTREEPASNNTPNHGTSGKPLPQPFHSIVIAKGTLNNFINPVHICCYATKTHARKNSKKNLRSC
jgi:hypothetical protein